MARPREPIRLIEAKGKKHLSKEEVEARLAKEVQPCTDDIAAPSYLTKKQRSRFDELAYQLQKIKIMGETDVDALARYVTAQALYEQATRELRSLVKAKPKKADTDPAIYFDRLAAWASAQNSLARLQDRYFKQAGVAARDLGLTISSRCKLAVPATEEEPKQNKFAQFAAGRAASE